MNGSLGYMDKLARRARQEQAPQGDVSRRVLARLPQRETALGTPLAVFATGYAALASAALFYGYTLLEAVNDPLLSMFQQASALLP